MKRVLVIILCAILCVLPSCFSYSEPKKSTEATTLAKYEVEIDVKCAVNLIFAKYDLKILVDGKSLGTMEHGTSKTYTIELEEGNHTLTVCKESDASISKTERFSVDKTHNYVTCNFTTHVNIIEFTEFEESYKGVPAKEDPTEIHADDPNTESASAAEPETEAPITEVATTMEAPTTIAPTTPAPTTPAPTTPAPTTIAPTTPAPTTVAPTTPAPTTIAPTPPSTTAPPRTAAPTMTPTMAPTAAPTAPPASGGVTYVGNANTGKFHRPNCASVSRMNPGNKVFFYGGRDEPLRLGYEPCKNCKP